MSKRELLGKIFGWCKEYSYKPHCSIDALAEQAIVIECDIKQYGKPYPVETELLFPTATNEDGGVLYFDGHHGTPGKALAIIVPLEEEDESSS